MSDAPPAIPRREVVRIGELKVARGGDVLFTIGLGSCVCIALYDAATGVGGMAHVMLPASSEGRRGAPAGRFADTAVPALLAMMRDAGVNDERLTARLAGGSSMFENVLTEGGRSLGARNVAAVRAALDAAAIPIAGENVGGEHGRSVYLETADGRLLVRSVRLPDVTL